MKSNRSSMRTPLPSARYGRTIVATYPLQVYSRVRPLRPAERVTCVAVKDDKTITLTPPENQQRRDRREYNYKFKMVFGPQAQQKDVYQEVARPLVEQLFVGVNGLLFAYGVTGSGKTYTMTGDANNQGIIPMCLDTIFRAIGDCQADKFIFKGNQANGFAVQSVDVARAERRMDVQKKWAQHKKVFQFAECSTPKGGLIKGVNKDSQYAVFVTYFEIYNNSVFDLLEEGAMNKVPQSKVIREDADHNMYIHGVTEVEVKSVSEAMDVFCCGQKRKHMGHTLLNAESSRSHSVFNIRLVTAPTVTQQAEVKAASNNIRVTQLSLVDLAGSERSLRTQNTGVKLREAGNINNSLLTLRTCLDYLRENNKGGSQPKKIPYRDSKITLLFKNYFEGEGQISMIVCINPVIEEFDENFQVLKFAEASQELILTKMTPLKVQNGGLTPGYRNGKGMLPSEQGRMQMSSHEVKDVPNNNYLLNVMEKKIPRLDFNSLNAKEDIENMVKFMENRIAARRALKKKLECKWDQLRARLVNSEIEMNTMRDRIATLPPDSEQSMAMSNALNEMRLESERSVHDLYQMLPHDQSSKPTLTKGILKEKNCAMVKEEKRKSRRSQSLASNFGELSKFETPFQEVRLRRSHSLYMSPDVDV